MRDGIILSGREQRMAWDLTDALGASTDLRAVLNDAYGVLLQLFEADYCALAVTRSDGTGKFDWIGRNLAPAFLASYEEEMAPHDFVLSAVQAKSGMVVRDGAMIRRPALERNKMYLWAREVGSPIEQVMAVMMLADRALQSGLSLYRARQRPFTERHQRMLQQFTRVIATAVRALWLSERVARQNSLLEAVLGSDKRAVLVVRYPAQEVERLGMATELLDTWFTPSDRGAESLPRVLIEELSKARVARAGGAKGPWSWKTEKETAELKVKIVAWPEPVGEPFWLLVLREVPRFPTLSDLKQPLSPRQMQVARGVMHGWDTTLIAEHLDSAPNTVKKQLNSIYFKVGVPDRKKLISFLWQALLDA